MVIVLLLVLLGVSLFYLVKFALIILKMQDAVEETLDVLDERYRSISKILEIPLFYDSPQIRQVVSDIKVARDTVLLVANRFASIDSDAVEEEERAQ
jgi:hypothetical protein